MEENKTTYNELHLYNSLTKSLELFKPLTGNKVNFYICGPTVYDIAHLGHARAYMSFDTVRKVMRDYFGYDVHYCMNITDIDDKIIKKANDTNQDFLDIARYYEADFLDDMKLLNVEMPDTMPRVSEYVEEIVDFIQVIINNGYAYESNGSVYFDVALFLEHGNQYPKLNQSSKNLLELLKEAEGVLTSEEAENEKKSKQDFALWKKSKENEPFWESPWGQGRPGWHIECSAMSTAVFRTNVLDIHAGGEDLKFPHHDNEMAQSEAYHGIKEWVKYFLHAGHLHIDKQKMSKSLKNFIKIKDFTKEYTPRQMRFLFLLQRWQVIMNFDPNTSMEEAIAKDKQFAEFFRNAKANVRNFDIAKHPQKWNEKDFALNEKLRESKALIHSHLCKSIDTPSVILELSNLITETNKYMNNTETQLKSPLVVSITQYISRISKCLGIIQSDGFSSSDGEVNEETIVKDYVQAAVDFRDKVKQLAMKPDNKKLLIGECDALRDVALAELGIKLEDTGMVTPSKWTKEDPQVLLAEIEQKRVKKEREMKEKQERKELEEKKKSTPPSEYFKTFEADKYSKFDENGLPTHSVPDEDGKEKELSKEQINGLKKKMKGLEKKYQKYIQKLEADKKKEEDAQ